MKRIQIGPKKVPFLVTSDGRTIRYPDPMIRVNDVIQVDIATGKITDHIKFETGKFKNKNIHNFRDIFIAKFDHAVWRTFAPMTFYNYIS